MEGLSEVTLLERGEVGGRRLLVADLTCSWEVNRAGSLAFRAPVADVLDAGWTAPLLGAWVRYDHPTAGSWGGVITSAGSSDGVVEVGAQSFHILTRKRLVRTGDIDDKPLSGTPGGLFAKCFSLANTTMDGASDTMPLTLGSIDSGGESLEVSFADDDFYDTVIPALTSDVGYEWKVDAQRRVSFGQTLGRDRTETVALREGFEVASSRWVEDMWPLANVIVGSGIVRVTRNGRTARYRATRTVADPASVARYGALQEVRAFSGRYDSESAIQALAEQALAKAVNTPALADLTVVDHDRAFERFREGDRVTVELPLSGVRRGMRVMIRSLDVAAGTMTVSGEALR